MGRFVIYSKDGRTERCVSDNLEYNGTWMGECFVSITIKSNAPIPFEIGDYLIYRGDKYEINYDPSALKKASRNSSGEAFVYDNVKFNSPSDELTRCDFLDYVKGDNLIHFTSLPKFSFFAASIQDLADRIQVNLDRIYSYGQKWTVEVHPEYVNTTDVNIDVSNIKVWDALAFVNSKFKSNFIIRGRRITIGTAGIAVGNIFQYGKGNGLYEIHRVADNSQAIITRLRAYGNTRNLPDHYYSKPKDYIVKAAVTEFAYSFGSTNSVIFNVEIPNLKAYVDADKLYDHYSIISVTINGITYDDAQFIYASNQILLISSNESDIRAIKEGVIVTINNGIDKEKIPGKYKTPVGVVVPNNMAVNNLMLPGFPDDTLDPYIDSHNLYALGIREGTVFFDGSNGDLPDIYPSLEGMTAQQLIDAGLPCSIDSGDNGNLDEVYSAEQVMDEGRADENYAIELYSVSDSKSTDTLTLPVNPVRSSILLNCFVVSQAEANSYVLSPKKDFSCKFNVNKIEGVLAANIVVKVNGKEAGRGEDSKVTPIDGVYMFSFNSVTFDVKDWDSTISVEIEIFGFASIFSVELGGSVSYGKNLSKFFSIRLKDIGFDINEHLSGEDAVISMRSGMCGGREFKIQGGARKPYKEGNKWVITCEREYDESLKLYFPYKDYNIQPGDKFTLLGIEMPDAYIKTASQKLLEAAKEYLAKNDYARYSYEPNVDEIYMARQHDEAIRAGYISIHDTIKEGDLMLFTDEDLGIEGSITIDSLSIKESEGKIPQYTITLRDDKTVGTIQRIQNQIDSIAGGQGIGGLNTEQIASVIQAVGNRMFLSKTKPDQTDHLLKLLGGIVSENIQSEFFSPGTLGNGYLIKVDPDTGKSYIEVDELFVRIKAMFTALEIKKLTYAGGNWVFSPAGMKCSKVDEFDDYYRCYFTADDGETRVENEFAVDDQVRNWEFNIKPGIYENVSNRSYWRKCVAVGEDYIDLSKTDRDPLSDDAPQAGDSLATMGNRTDKSRQSVIAISAYGEGSPSVILYENISDYSLTGKDSIVISPNGSKFKGDFFVKNGDSLLSVVEGMFKSELNKYTFFFEQSNNFLANAVFIENLDAWENVGNAAYFDPSGLLWMNGGLFLSSEYIVSIENYQGGNVLHVRNSSIMQRNSRLKDWVDDEYFVKVKISVIRSGNLTYGFSNGNLYYNSRLEATNGFVEITSRGRWDGKGDFKLSFSGEAYISYVLLVNKDSTEVNRQSVIEQLINRITFSVSKNNVVSSINISENGVKIEGKKIELKGAASFNDNVKITEDGTIQAKNAYIEGEIHATKGTFSGAINTPFVYIRESDAEVLESSIISKARYKLNNNLNIVSQPFLDSVDPTDLGTMIYSDYIILPTSLRYEGANVCIVNACYPPYTKAIGSIRPTIVMAEEGYIHGYPQNAESVEGVQDITSLEFLNGILKLIAVPEYYYNDDFSIIKRKVYWHVLSIEAIDKQINVPY